MPDGSPIDLWWKSHLPPKVTTTPKHAVHAPRSAADPRPYCGHRDRNAMILVPRSRQHLVNVGPWQVTTDILSDGVSLFVVAHMVGIG